MIYGTKDSSAPHLRNKAAPLAAAIQKNRRTDKTKTAARSKKVPGRTPTARQRVLPPLHHAHPGRLSLLVLGRPLPSLGWRDPAAARDTKSRNSALASRSCRCLVTP